MHDTTQIISPAETYLAPCLVQAVALLARATGSNPTLDSNWFAQWLQWLYASTTQCYTPGAMRLRHALALFAVEAIEDQGSPYNQQAVQCIALYLQSLCNVSPEELNTPMWEQNDDIELAYAQVPRHSAMLQENPWSAPNETTVSSFLVMDVICGVIKTISFKVQLNTPYRHCTPLLMRLLTNKDWDPCKVIAHFRSMRRVQFELLNYGAHDLPGESQTVHGMLAMHLFSYMHSTSWKPENGPYLHVLDEVVWDVLCLTGIGNQANQWLDTLKSGLPNAGLQALELKTDLERPPVLDGFPPLTMVRTPSFLSLRAYADVACQDAATQQSRAQWFEHRYPRLAHAMHTLLLVLPCGAMFCKDWDTLNEWWRQDVQGLDPAMSASSLSLPQGFD